MTENTDKIRAAMPRKECADGIYEIDEFDCASCFLVEGTERALLIDTGVGIGSLRQQAEDILRGKPYDVIITHSHLDHTGGAGQFDRVRMYPAGAGREAKEMEPSLSSRREYAELIRKRTGKAYPYDPEKDILPWQKAPGILPLADGETFDLGGRKVTAYACPGHTADEIVLADDRTKTLLCGDACNCNWLLNTGIAPTLRGCAETALAALERIMEKEGTAFSIRSVFNFHHDFRLFGQPLAPEVLPDLVCCLKTVLDGTAHYESVPDPLSPEGKDRKIARYGTVMVSCMGSDIETGIRG